MLVIITMCILQVSYLLFNHIQRNEKTFLVESLQLHNIPRGNYSNSIRNLLWLSLYIYIYTYKHEHTYRMSMDMPIYTLVLTLNINGGSHHMVVLLISWRFSRLASRDQSYGELQSTAPITTRRQTGTVPGFVMEHAFLSLNTKARFPQGDF